MGEYLTIKLSEDVMNVLQSNWAYIGETKYDPDGTKNEFVTELCVENLDYEHIFIVRFDGTERSFIRNAIRELEKYNVTYDAIDVINNGECHCLNDIVFYVDMMEEFESACIWLLRSLDELEGFRVN